MIPHAPPIRFELTAAEGPFRGTVLLPDHHPLCGAKGYPALALVELAAQLAGRALSAGAGPGCAPSEPPARSGMLVELDEVILERSSVPAGTRLHWQVTPLRTLGSLHRFSVVLQGLMSLSLTLRIS